ncbi:major facilitator superfamily domain-containing protein, partial [Melampsora americana]
MSTDYPIYDPRNLMHEDYRRKVVRKIDLHTVPCVMLLYLANFSLERDLRLEGIQFNIALSAFTISYVMVKIPSNLILRRVGAKIWLPFLVFCWGTVTIFSAFMTNFASLIAVRMMLVLSLRVVTIYDTILAVFEGGLQPGVILYLSTVYKPDELQLRFGLSYCSTSLSHMIGGFLAFGIQHGMDGFAGKSAWCVETAPYLNVNERKFAAKRLQVYEDFESTEKKTEEVEIDEMATYCETKGQSANSEVFEWSEVRRAFADPQVWLIGLSEASLSIPLAALSIFFDLILIFAKHTEIRYGAFFLILAGLLPAVPCLVCIIPINTFGFTKRATCIGMQGM